MKFKENSSYSDVNIKNDAVTKDNIEQKSSENTFFGKALRYLGPASAGALRLTTMALAVQRANSIERSPMPEAPGSALAPMDYNLTDRNASSLVMPDKGVQFASDRNGYVPTPEDYENFQKLKQAWENPSWVFTSPPDTHEPSGNEISRPATDASSHQLEQDKSTMTEFPKLGEEEINSVKTFVDSLEQNKTALQGFRKMLRDKESMEGMANLMGDEKFRERALLELKNKESVEQAISLLENKESTAQLLSLLKDKGQVEKVSQSMSSQESEGVHSKERQLNDHNCGPGYDYDDYDDICISKAEERQGNIAAAIIVSIFFATFIGCCCCMACSMRKIMRESQRPPRENQRQQPMVPMPSERMGSR